VSGSIVQNRFTARSLSKYYFDILDHIEYILPSSVARLHPVVCLPFKMFVFLS
jgi:hypothetical protein